MSRSRGRELSSDASNYYINFISTCQLYQVCICIDAHIYIYMHAQLQPYTHIYVCVYIYMPASNPTEWAIFRPQNVKEQRDRRKTMAEKGEDKKEEETLKHEKKHTVGGVSWPFLTIKLGIF